MASPIPWLAPVTTATLDTSRNSRLLHQRQTSPASNGDHLPGESAPARTSWMTKLVAHLDTRISQ